MKITGCVITFNEEARIERCLRSLASCDEIVVVDSRSTDRTREIAAACGARVIDRDWPGYRSQKNFAVAAGRHDWVLALDADEWLNDELAAEIDRLRISGPGECAGFLFDRRWIYFGRELRHGDAGHDRHVRLFDRRRADFGGYEVHERVAVRGPVRRLGGGLMHDSYRDLAHQLEKLDGYARLMGASLHAAGKRGSRLHLFANPAWRFLRAYVLRLGMLDGWRGLVYALADARYVRAKYLHLLVLGKTAGSPGR